MLRWRGSFWHQSSALLALLCLAALLRLWRIDQIPPGFHFDESFEGLEAWRILTEPRYRPIFLEGNFGVPPLNAYANALTFALAPFFGGEAGPTAMRVTAAIFGVLGVWTTFALAQELRLRTPDLLSPQFPWLAAAILATMRWHLHFSRMGIEPVMVPMFWAAAMWLLLRAGRTGAWWAYLALGLVLALSMYAYQGAWVIPPLVALTALHLLWTEHTDPVRRTHSWRALVAAGVVAVAGVVPLVIFFLAHPDLLIMRPAQIAIVGQTASPADSTIGDALWATAKMFGPFGMPGDQDPRRNLPGAPALNVWQAIPFYLGLLLALWHNRRVWQREAVGTTLLMVGLVGLLLPGIISEYAPHFHRILGAAAPVALLCGMGLDGIWHASTRFQSAQVRSSALAALGPLVAVLLLVLGTVTTTRDYFVRWANLPDLFYAFDSGLWDLGQWVAQQQSGNAIYISPQGENHATLAFAWRNRPADRTSTFPDLVQPDPVQYDGRYVLPLVAGETQTAEHYAVIEHEDFRSPLLLPGVFPELRIDYTIYDPAGHIYAQVYTRPAATTPSRQPTIPLALTVGDGIRLIGYDILPEPVRAGGSLYVQYHWQVAELPSTNWTVYTHVVDGHGNVVIGFDSPPGRGALKTTLWQPGWRVLDEVEVLLPADLVPGEYTLRMGLYDEAGKVLPATGTGVDLGPVLLTE